MITISPLVHNSSDLAGACCQPHEAQRLYRQPDGRGGQGDQQRPHAGGDLPGGGCLVGGVSVAVAVCPASGPVSVVSMNGAESSTARQRSKGGPHRPRRMVARGRGGSCRRGPRCPPLPRRPEADRAEHAAPEPGPRGFCHVRVVDRRVTRLADHHPLIRRVVR